MLYSGIWFTLLYITCSTSFVFMIDKREYSIYDNRTICRRAVAPLMDETHHLCEPAHCLSTFIIVLCSHSDSSMLNIDV